MSRVSGRFVSFSPLLLLLLATACVSEDGPQTGDVFFDEISRHGQFLPREIRLQIDELLFESGQSTEERLWQAAAPRPIVVDDGWGGPEDWGAWGLGELTRIRFLLRQSGPHDLFIDAMAARHPEGRPQIVTVRINGTTAGRFEAPEEWTEHRLTLPAEALSAGVNELELVYDFHLEGNARDDRPRALAFKRLAILPAAELPRPASLSGPGYRVFTDQELILFEESGAWVVPLHVPHDAAELSFEAMAETPVGNADRARLSVRLLDLEGDSATLLEFDAPEAPNAGSGTPALHRHALSLREHRGRSLILALQVGLPHAGRLTLRAPRLVRDTTVALPSAAVLPSFPERPPIVVIILDAARADHFGVYGYSRDTTPNSDRLAAEGVVFRQAIAECSYTLCSMPALMSGLTFPQHGLVVPGLRLSDDAVTLAEKLSSAGYRAIGITGNPNNSRLTGAGQGFERLREIWEVHPGRMTAAAIGHIAEAAAEDAPPLYLLLHYVPPHEPYTPDPEFDLFGDPDYGGSLTGTREDLIPIFERLVTPSEADLREMISLYDGNLRMADDAVGRVLAALAEAGLYEDALVIVTSDHGEGMMEHGWAGHNTTVYEGMIHIPLIVKWPEAWREALSPPETTRLSSLADIPATILHLLGLETPPEILAPSLLAPAEAARDRVLFLRSANGKRPYLGVRGQRFKAIQRRLQLPELYDVLADPGERANLAHSRPWLHAGLLGLFAEAAETGGRHADRHQGEMTEEDREMLRALGYL